MDPGILPERGKVTSSFQSEIGWIEISHLHLHQTSLTQERRWRMDPESFGLQKMHGNQTLTTGGVLPKPEFGQEGLLMWEIVPG